MARVITQKSVQKKLPQSWISAAGILRNKKIDPIKYRQQIRREWEARLRKLERLHKQVRSK